MNTKPNVPDEIWLGKQEYSIWTDWKVNRWLFVAALISGACDILFSQHVRQWSVEMRAIVAVLPFLALLLWARSLSHWIRGMDELHRRIIVPAVLFAASATFFFVMLWHRLDKAGLFTEGRDIGTIAHIFLLLTFFYFLGYSIFNRRYK